ncbi:MAG: efflux RND transporter periplasmic adaptor subunit [Deltaproteobacteria bacterium]|nr:efflux RND transporter periplasmic adaptor subunit [Deltaproteobacteria bacterium]
MATNTENPKTRSPLRVVLITAVVTLGVTGGAAYFFGWLSPPGAGVATAPQPVGEAGGQKGEKTLYTCGMHPWIISEEPGTCPICGMELVPKRDEASQAEAAASGKKERKILYWRAPMNPTEIYDHPGKSKMGMDLVPVYEDEVVGGVEVRIDPVIQQNMGIRTAPVEKGPLVRTIRTYGHVTYDETRTATVSPKFGGWIEKLYVDFTGQLVKKGDPLFEIYSPDLVSAQEEYLTAYRSLSETEGGGDLLASARRRLEYMDIPPDQIRAIEKFGKVRRTLLIRSPFTGVVTHKKAVEGVFVKAGQPVYQIADLSKVWVEAHIYEYELPWVKVGQEARMTLPYQPGKVYVGKVTYVYPYLQRQTRDVVIRLEFDNPDLELKPDMYADVELRTTLPGEGLLIPSEAVLRSGERNVVFVTRGDGKFTPREVTLGLEVDGGKVQILSGVAEGEYVVTSGQFLLDSESKLKEAVQKMLEAKMGKPQAEKPAKPSDDFFDDMDGDEAGKKKDDFFEDM